MATQIERVITYLLYQAVYIYSLIVMAAVIVSWVAPHSRNAVVKWLRAVTEPVFAKVRQVVPPMGGIDLSPMIVILALMLLRRFI